MAKVSDNDPVGANNLTRTASRSRRAGSEDVTHVELAPAEPTAISPVSFDQQPTCEEIAAEAYAIYEARGGHHGSDEDDWHEAERRLAQRRRQAE